MEAESRVDFSLPAVAENVALVRHVLAGFAEALDMEPAEIADLKTVVTEACMNAVVHAYGSDEQGLLEVEAWPESDGLQVIVRDYGAGIRPLADVEHRSLRLGLPLIAALTLSFELSGSPGQGTEVRMRIPFSSASTNGDPRVVPTAEETRIRLPSGDLLAPVLSRVISMFATRADLSVDELSDAVLLSDALSASGTADFADETARIAIREEAGAFEVRVGPLARGGGQRLIDGLRIPELDASLEGLADEIRVDELDDGAEVLMIRISRAAREADPA
jgi:anti-sigma regulatory factor (Ser/Thr protein kinase)